MLNFNKKKYVSFDNLKSFNGLLQSSLKEKIDGYKSEVDTKVQKKFNELSGKVQTDSEVIDARKGEASLRAKIDVIDEDIKNVSSQLEHIEKYLTYSVNAKEFGCDNTGVEDCSDVVNELIKKYDMIYFPSGTYLFNNEIVIDKDLIFTGDVDTNIICKAKYQFSTKEETGLKYNIEFRNLNFEGNNLNIEGSLIRVFNVCKCLITNCSFNLNAFSTAIFIRDNSENVIIRDCKITSNRGGEHTGGAIWIRSSSGLIKNVTIDNCNITHYGKDECIAIWGQNIENVNVINSHLVEGIGEADSSVMFLSCYSDNSSHNIKNIKFDNCFIEYDRGYRHLIEVRNIDSDLIFSNCKIIGISDKQSLIGKGNTGLIFNMCYFNICKVGVMSDNVKAIFNNCEIKGGKSGTNFISVNKSLNTNYEFNNCLIDISSNFYNSTVAEGIVNINNCVIQFERFLVQNSNSHTSSNKGLEIVIKNSNFKTKNVEGDSAILYATGKCLLDIVNTTMYGYNSFVYKFTDIGSMVFDKIKLVNVCLDGNRDRIDIIKGGCTAINSVFTNCVANGKNLNYSKDHANAYRMYKQLLNDGDFIYNNNPNTINSVIGWKCLGDGTFAEVTR